MNGYRTQRAAAPVVSSGAIFSDDEVYRYTLERRWTLGPGYSAVFILLNPSTATAELDDPTIRRCMGYARRWGYFGLTVLNIFAYRSTDPRALKRVADPVGPLNEAIIREAVVDPENPRGRRIFCGWGAHGAYRGQGRRILELLFDAGARPWALRQTAGGEPAHPLYLPADLEPFPLRRPS